MPKIAKTARPAVLFNPAAAEERKPAVRFTSRPSPDFVDVLSVLSMHTNNNLSKEAKAFNNELKMTHLDNLILSVTLGKIHSLRDSTDNVDIMASDYKFESFELVNYMEAFPVQVIHKLNALGYIVAIWSDATDGCPATVYWGEEPEASDLYTLHPATGPLELKDWRFAQKEDDEEEEEIPQFDHPTRVWPAPTRLHANHDTIVVAAFIGSYRGRRVWAQYPPSFCVRVVGNTLLVSTLQDGVGDIAQMTFSRAPDINWREIALLLTTSAGRADWQVHTLQTQPTDPPHVSYAILCFGDA